MASEDGSASATSEAMDGLVAMGLREEINQIRADMDEHKGVTRSALARVSAPSGERAGETHIGKLRAGEESTASQMEMAVQDSVEAGERHLQIVRDDDFCEQAERQARTTCMPRCASRSRMTRSRTCTNWL